MASLTPFHPPFFLKNPHAMTLVPFYWRRGTLLKGMPVEHRLFATDESTQLLGFCHWQPDRRACGTVVLVHGLEGCSESHYMRGIASKAYRAGMNVVRMNQRNCGGTEHLSPTLYNSGLERDFTAVVEELATRDGLSGIWLAGYSMGGNLVLRAAAKLGSHNAMAGVIAVCPNIDPTQCVDALEQPRNWIYHNHFLTMLKARMRRKASLFPGKWDLTDLDRIRTLREFDHRYTAPDGGYRDGPDYYDRAGARHILGSLSIPTIVFTAQDDPFIPYSMFELPALRNNKVITFIAPRYGGHCGFFQQRRLDEDQFWVENRIVEVMRDGLVSPAVSAETAGATVHVRQLFSVAAIPFPEIGAHTSAPR